MGHAADVEIGHRPVFQAPKLRVSDHICYEFTDYDGRPSRSCRINRAAFPRDRHALNGILGLAVRRRHVATCRRLWARFVRRRRARAWDQIMNAVTAAHDPVVQRTGG